MQKGRDKLSNMGAVHWLSSDGHCQSGVVKSVMAASQQLDSQMALLCDSEMDGARLAWQLTCRAGVSGCKCHMLQARFRSHRYPDCLTRSSKGRAKPGRALRAV